MSKHNNNVGYTGIYNVLLDDVMPNLSPPAYIVLVIICRMTIGWVTDRESNTRKFKDTISQQQIADLSPYNRLATIAEAIDELSGKKIIKVEGSAKRLKTYSLNMEAIIKLQNESVTYEYEQKWADREESESTHTVDST